MGPLVMRFLLVMSLVLNALLTLALIGHDYWEIVPQEGTFPSFRLASAESKPELCMDDQTREQVRTVMLDALDAALKEHIVNLYKVWLKDDTGQPARAKAGAENGIRAYLNARKGAIDWSPPACASG